jgi:hypothetical protein
MRRKLCLFAGLAAFTLVQATTVRAATFGFYNITNNNAVDAAIGEAQFFVDVTNGGSSASFTFRNEGPDMAVITEIYFDDGSLLGISSIVDNPPDVDYVPGADPTDLPGGNLVSPPFIATQAFSAEPVPPPFQSGVGPAEQVTIVFDLIGGGTLQDVIDELMDGTLRIGIRGQGFDSEGSESFVNTPEPSSIVLLTLGMAAVASRRRRA